MPLGRIHTTAYRSGNAGDQKNADIDRVFELAWSLAARSAANTPTALCTPFISGSTATVFMSFDRSKISRPQA
jgi:hypothetical protein